MLELAGVEVKALTETEYEMKKVVNFFTQKENEILEGKPFDFEKWPPMVGTVIEYLHTKGSVGTLDESTIVNSCLYLMYLNHFKIPVKFYGRN